MDAAAEEEQQQAYKRQKLQSCSEYSAPQATHKPHWPMTRQQQQQSVTNRQQQQQQTNQDPLTYTERKKQRRQQRIQQLLQKLEGQPPFPFLQLPHSIMTAVASKLDRESA
jgi:hypothetical protein